MTNVMESRVKEFYGNCDNTLALSNKIIELSRYGGRTIMASSTGGTAIEFDIKNKFFIFAVHYENNPSNVVGIEVMDIDNDDHVDDATATEYLINMDFDATDEIGIRYDAVHVLGKVRKFAQDYQNGESYRYLINFEKYDLDQL